MAGTQQTSRPQWLRKWLLTTYMFCIALTTAQETFTDSACRAQTTAMNACAKRWDSIRTECTKSNTANSVWPGPCECSYFQNDLPCFDDQAFCAAQVWTQVPQWFRDGVSSCLMKDAGFTVRANLGSASGVMGNPFTVRDLPGRLTRTTASASGGGNGAAQTGASAGLASQTAIAESDVQVKKSEELSVGAKAGFGVGIGAGVILIALAAFLLVRSRKRPILPAEMDTEKSHGLSPVELHAAHAHQEADGKALNEMPGGTSQRFELGVRASTWLVELPIANSMRNSRQRVS